MLEFYPDRILRYLRFILQKGETNVLNLESYRRLGDIKNKNILSSSFYIVITEF